MLPGVDEFSEADYLEANPDVAAAVKAGTCRSGADITRFMANTKNDR